MANKARSAEVATIISYPILLDLADFALQEQSEGNLWSLFLAHGIMAHIP